MALHFIGFKGDEYNRAIKIWGQPDFVHRHNDNRSKQDIIPEDTVIYANGEENRNRGIYSFNDSEHF